MPRPRTSTRFADAKAKRERAVRLRESGLCYECETEPVTTNIDGTSSIRCVACKSLQKPKARTSIRTAAQTPRPRMMGEWGMADDWGYLDTKEFRDYAERLRVLITRSATPMSIGDMKRALGDDYAVRMTMDALDYISDTVEHFQAGVLSRYRPTVRRVESVLGWDKTLSFSPKDIRFADTGVMASVDAYARTA